MQHRAAGVGPSQARVKELALCVRAAGSCACGLDVAAMAWLSEINKALRQLEAEVADPVCPVRLQAQTLIRNNELETSQSHVCRR